ncbi:MAG: BrnT family toxin [Dehalococcoidia bacterium]
MVGWAFEFDWDAANRQHIALHDVEPAEAEQAYLDPNAVTLEESIVEGEAREAVIGLTPQGRLLVVVVADYGDRLRVVTARPASRREQRVYVNG